MPLSLSSDAARKLSSTIEALLTAWSLVRASAPRLILKEKEERDFVEKLLLAHRALSELLSLLGLDKQENELISALSELNPNETLLLVVPPSLMRRLVGVGIPHERVISIGGPLSAEDAKALNPHLPEEAMKGVEARLKNFWRELERKIKGARTVLFILEKAGKVDELIAKRASMLSEKFGVDVKVVYLTNLDSCVEILPRFFRRE
ncbi:MAG: DUF2100 domain-containing protein [Candidatus Jordarchaeales archaeon]